MYWLTQFGSTETSITELPAGAPEMPLTPGPAAPATVALPGGRVFDGHGAGRAPVRLPYELRVKGMATDTEWSAWLARRGERDQLFRDDGAWCWARLLGVEGTRRPEHQEVAPITLTFQVLSRWYAAETEDLEFSGTLEYDYSGADDATDVVMTLDNGATAAVTGLVVENLTLSTQLAYTGTVAAGKALVIDTGTQAVLNDWVGDYTHLTRPTNDWAWFRLRPGANQLRVTITGGGANTVFSLQFYPVVG